MHGHACMGMEASCSESMGAKSDYDQLRPSGIEDRIVGEQVGLTKWEKIAVAPVCGRTPLLCGRTVGTRGF